MCEFSHHVFFADDVRNETHSHASPNLFESIQRDPFVLHPIKTFARSDVRSARSGVFVGKERFWVSCLPTRKNAIKMLTDQCQKRLIAALACAMPSVNGGHFILDHVLNLFVSM